ncbi:hypothetical protein AYM40_22980 [Paraburkholderia phytofirmans OLGA172]|uniref:Uncharacterized protein n=1 Tax=Paraburkholderia phytofirmans OLGA172 TaxID=1417228 RepID=A0A160FQQ5_9BURK|nr:hypothetical protein AYM40_22980 [Paraburkholderia phytofirmans OLGA172]
MLKETLSRSRALLVTDAFFKSSSGCYLLNSTGRRVSASFSRSWTPAPPRATRKTLNAKKIFDMLAGGCGPAGAAAAIDAAHKDIRTGVPAERFGGQVLYTMAIETSYRCRKRKD